MASCAGAIFKVEGKNVVPASGCADFVAIAASDRYVSARQGEARSHVLGNRKSGAVPIRNGMATFATILVGRSSELFIVLVLVAIQTSVEFKFENCIRASGNVAFVACNGSVLAEQRIF